MSVTTRVILVAVLLLLILGVLFALRPRKTSGSLQAAFDAEFLTRPDGYLGLKEAYGFAFPSEPMQMDPGLMYRSLAQGDVDVIDGFATDGRIPAYDLLILEDDQNFFPPYYAAPLVRAETLGKYPQIEGILNSLAGQISDATMQGLNYEVDEEGRKAREVAREFLVSADLLSPTAQPSEGLAGTVSIGGKHFTEQEILGEMMAILLECKSGLRVKRNLNLGGTLICFNALKAGDLDLYAEYTGTGLVNILDREALSDPEETYQVVQREFRQQYNLMWLKSFGFNNTYTLTMRRDQARRLGIQSISDLAEYVGKHAPR